MPDESYNKHHRLESGTVVSVILRIMALGGLLTMAVVAPNAIQALPTFIPQLRRKQYVESTLARLIKKGLIQRSQTKSKKAYFVLTPRGREMLSRYQLKEFQITIPRHWDKKWRVVIFDVKEMRRGDRDRLRRQLIEFGFARLQNSVWVIPYECEELIQLLKTSFRLGREIIYFTTNGIDGDFALREKFDLAQE